MNKKSLYTLLLDLIFIAVFNLIYFLTEDVGDREISAWIGYAFIHIAYLFIIVTPILTKDKAPAVLGLSVNAISIIYFIVEIIAGIILILVNSDDAMIPIIAEILITGVYGAAVLSVLITNEKTTGAVERAQIESRYIMDASSRIQALENQLSDPSLRAPIDRVYYLLHSSPTKTNQYAAQAEYEILNTVYELENAVYADDQIRVNGACSRLTALINERNRLIKVNQ